METVVYTEIPLPEHLCTLLSPKPICRLPASGVYLAYDERGLSLCHVGEKGRVQVDFVTGTAQYRRTKGGGELIGKAVNHSSQPTVWDATGGLGRDSFVLASLGLNVRTFEQNTAVFALLADGVARAQQIAEIETIVARMTLVHGNATDCLIQQATALGQPDVVYLDPMYPERQKTAAVKKEMAYFHQLIGLPAPSDDVSLLEAACKVAKKRVVVKRPRLGEFLANVKPAYQYSGKSTRFDVYLPNTL